ncbi:MAG TPA: L,D-transpeptidase [Geobacteraceae bacterium]|nr:L,D-transpeptidase [Geobacteraceae bacterium]
MKKILLFGAFFLSIMIFTAPVFAGGRKVKSLCDLHFPSDSHIEWECRKLRWGDKPEDLFGEYWPHVLRFNRMDRRHFIGGVSIKVAKCLEDLVGFTPLPEHYPDAAEDEKFILVDQSEMYLGAYEYGNLVFSFPVAVGIKGNRVPNGEFRLDAADRRHKSNLYTIAELGRRYPMHYGLRFYVDKKAEGWPSYWIHGRDLPGYPASHGCIGLYDEEMQQEYYSTYDKKVNRKYYQELTPPLLEDAKELYLWVLGSHGDPGTFHRIEYGPRMLIIGSPPI